MAVSVGQAIGYLDLDISGFSKGLQTAGSAFKRGIDDMTNEALTGTEKIQSVFVNFGNGLTTIGVNATKYLTIPIATAVAGVVKSFGDLEQSFGGIETMFKESSDIVIKNSETAYKRAGTSANNYMEQVTAFSATLLRSVGNNAEEAARIADIAMVDMSDNTNKFGTNLGSIQDTYQSLARQQYQLLDNLRLGYGGTQEEMKRLLADAEKLTGIKYNIDNFSDVIQAIHVIQDELGIVGTTAEEAATTVNGSFTMLKGAFQNFIAGLGMEGADMKQLTANLVDAFKIAFENVIRVVQNLWDNIDLGAFNWAKNVIPIALAFGPVVTVIGNISTGIGNMIGMIGKAAKAGNDFLSIMSHATVTGPWGLLALAIGAVVTAILLLSDKTSDYQKHIQDITDTTNELDKASDAFTEKVKEQNAAFDEQKETIKADAEVQRQLLDEINALIVVENKSEEQKKRLYANIDALNSMNEDLNLTYDEQRNQLSMTNDELLKYIQNVELSLSLEVAREDALNGIRNRREAIKALNEQEELRRVILEDIAIAEDNMATSMTNATSGMIGGIGKTQEYNSALATLNENLATAEQNIADQKATIAEADADYAYYMDLLARGMQARADAFAEQNTQVKLLEEQRKLQMDADLAWIDSQRTLYSEYATIVTDIYREVSDAQTVTLEEAAANLNATTEQFIQHQKDLVDLQKVGLGELSQDLIEFNNQNAQQARVWLEAIEEANGGVITSYENLNSNAKSKIDDLNNAMNRATTTLVEDAKSKWADPGLINAPGKAIGEMADGVMSRDDLEVALDETATKGKEAVIARYPEFRTTGNEVSSAIGDGITQNTGYMFRETNSAIDSVKNNSVIAVDNANFESTGQGIDQGIASGISQNSYIVNNAVTHVVNEAKRTADQAAGINSPARLFIPVGEGIDEGIAFGVEKNEYSLDAVDNLINEMSDTAQGFETPQFDFSQSLISANKFFGELEQDVEKFTQFNFKPAMDITDIFLKDLYDKASSFKMPEFNFSESLIGFEKFLEEAKKQSEEFSSTEFDFTDAFMTSMGNAVSHVAENQRDWGMFQQQGYTGEGDTFNFYSPVAIDEVEAARLLKQTKRDISEGF